jgi:hypothetical protein
MVSNQTNHKENPMAYETEYTLLEDVIQMSHCLIIFLAEKRCKNQN